MLNVTAWGQSFRHMPDQDLLDDLSGYDPNDGWHVLRRGEVAGTFQSRERTLVLRGGDRFRVELDEPYGEDCGVDAPPGTVGELVAIAERVGCAGLKTADGTTYIANMADLRVERRSSKTPTLN